MELKVINNADLALRDEKTRRGSHSLLPPLWCPYLVVVRGLNCRPRRSGEVIDARGGGREQKRAPPSQGGTAYAEGCVAKGELSR